MGIRHAVGHDEGMHQKALATSLKALRALRSAVPSIVLLAGLVILVADLSAAFGWALVVFGAALVAGQASGNQGSGPGDRRALPR